VPLILAILNERLNEHVMEHRLITRYDSVSQALHWATALLVLWAYINGLGGSESRVYLPLYDSQRQIHETVGLGVFLFVAVRLLWRLVEIRPAPRPVARWMNITAKLTQSILYVLLFAVPCTAIVGAWLEGHPLTLLGGLAIQPPSMVSHNAGAAVARFHTWLGCDHMAWGIPRTRRPLSSLLSQGFSSCLDASALVSPGKPIPRTLIRRTVIVGGPLYFRIAERLEREPQLALPCGHCFRWDETFRKT
jgi:cytochrome b561